ncbi:MAG TPA: hypothetical protein IAB59_03595 [Candidatus Onthousia faecipullorum]|uniref:Thioredoxin domain-containing protein n=1 Tax=Candidatus Onthousia faecipullorum TaxID=2840887 RepID=A0A9D1GB60_9FIRM|nr:hypothetical protein [Candidatus Onthousia faecipullorum]
MKSKKKQKQNYVILVVIYVVVIVLVLYLASIYNSCKSYQKEIPVLKDVVLEINPSEVEHYLTENPSPILYLCTASDDDCREFEEAMKSPLEKNNYEDLVYVNLEDIEDKMTFVNDLLAGTDYSIDRVPCLIKFTDGIATDIEDGLNGAVLTRDEALNFLDANDRTEE